VATRPEPGSAGTKVLPAITKPKKKTAGGGSFLSALKKQVRDAEEKVGTGAHSNLSLDETEKQGQNQGVFSYLQPPMGH
jgi:hypothetical protein